MNIRKLWNRICLKYSEIKAWIKVKIAAKRTEIAEKREADRLTWSVSNSPRKRSSGGGGGSSAGGVLVQIFIAIVLIFVGLYFIAEFVPILGNITNPGGISGTFLTLAEWIVPLLAIVGLIIYGVHAFMGHGRK